MDFDELKHQRELFTRERNSILAKAEEDPLPEGAWQRYRSVLRAIAEIDAAMSELLADDPMPCATDDYAP